MRRVAVALTILLPLTACTTTSKPPPAAAPRGGTLRVGITEPGSLDPGNAYEPMGTLVDSLLCEPLLTLDPETGRLRPGLATNWVISDGGRRITLRLRKARFSNDKRVTSDDVIASLSRAASEEFAGHAADLLDPIAGWPGINGREETKSEHDQRIMWGLSAIDGRSLSITLRRRDADFVRVLAHAVAAPVPKGSGDNPVCAGPYKLVQPWSPGQAMIRLVRNEHYSGDNPGYADTVEFHVSTDPFAAYQRGEVDVAAVLFAQRGVVDPADLHERPSGYLEYVGLPLEVFDADARRALSRALDRQAIAEATGRRPATGFVPGGVDCAAGGGPELRSNLTMPLYFNDEFDNRRTAELVAKQWHDKVGLEVRPTAVPFDDIVGKGVQPQGVDGAFRFGWQPSVARPEAYLGPLFTSQGIGRDNLTRFVDPTFERILDREARRATKQGDVDAGYRRAERRLCEEMPMVPVAEGVARWAVRSAALGTAGKATLDRAGGAPVLRELFVRTGREPVKP